MSITLASSQSQTQSVTYNKFNHWYNTLQQSQLQYNHLILMFNVRLRSTDRRPTSAARTGARSRLAVNHPIIRTGGAVCRRRLPGMFCPNRVPRLGTDKCSGLSRRATGPRKHLTPAIYYRNCQDILLF